MARDLNSIIQDMVKKGYFDRIARNPLAQFGTPRRRYLGASLLPNKTRNENQFKEDMLTFRTLIANDTTRFSPSQKKGVGARFASFSASLGEQDVASEFTGQHYDALIDLLQRNASMEAMASIVGWVEKTINLALEEKLEVDRWGAIVNAAIVRKGDNGIDETIDFPNDSGHRVTAAGTWSDPAYDPYEEIVGMVEFLRGKGRTVTKVITSYKNVATLVKNPNIATRTSKVRIDETGQLTSITSRVTQAMLNGFLSEDGIPPLTLYDLRYTTLTGQERFLPEDAMVFVCETGVDEQIVVGETERFIPDVLGYTAIGRSVGQSGPGRVIKVNAYDNKPPRIEAEGWQTTLPIITDPEAIAVISGIA